MRLSLHPQRGLAARGSLNLAEEWRAHLLNRLKRQIDLTADPALIALLSEVQAYPTGLPYTTSRLAPPTEMVIPFRIRIGAGVLSFFSTTMVFGTPVEVTLSELAPGGSFFPSRFFPGDRGHREIIGAVTCSVIDPARGSVSTASSSNFQTEDEIIMHRRNLLRSTAAATAVAVMTAADRRAAAQPISSSPGGEQSAKLIETADGAALFHRDWGQGRPILFVAAWAPPSEAWQYPNWRTSRMKDSAASPSIDAAMGGRLIRAAATRSTGSPTTWPGSWNTWI